MVDNDTVTPISADDGDDIAPEIGASRAPKGTDLMPVTQSSTLKEKRALMKSRVRVWITYGAALYVLLFGAILCGLLLWFGSDAAGMAEAKDLFLATLPIGSGILAYWFAARGRSSSGDGENNGDTRNQ